MRQKKQKSNRPLGTRHLRVGEEIRHALSEILQHGHVAEFESFGVPVTVTEVRVSPDLRHATAYVVPLGGMRQTDIMKNLRDCTTAFRTAMAAAVDLRYAPNLRFEADTSFDEAEKINKLLQQAKAQTARLPADDE